MSAYSTQDVTRAVAVQAAKEMLETIDNRTLEGILRELNDKSPNPRFACLTNFYITEYFDDSPRVTWSRAVQNGDTDLGFEEWKDRYWQN